MKKTLPPLPPLSLQALRDVEVIDQAVQDALEGCINAVRNLVRILHVECGEETESLCRNWNRLRTLILAALRLTPLALLVNGIGRGFWTPFQSLAKRLEVEDL
jgi:hypothetical protein